MIKKVTPIDKKVSKLVKISITKEDIIKMLNDKGEQIPDNAEVVFQVPSGGDYSGMDLNVDIENPVKITFRR